MADEQVLDEQPRSIPLTDLLVSVLGLVAAYSLWRYPLLAERLGPGLQAALFIGSLFSIVWGLRHLIFRVIVGRESRVLGRFGRHRVMLPRPGLVFLIMMLIMALGSLLGHSNMLMLVFAMMAGPFVLNGWIVFSMLKRTELHRKVPRRAMVGQPISVEIQLTNHKRFLSSRLMTVADEITNGIERLTGRVMFVRVPPRRSETSRYQVCLMQRGRYTFGPALVSSSFPLGLGERGLVYSNRETVIVYPRVGRLDSRWKYRLQDASLLVQRQRTRRGTYEDEFHRIREYRDGDNPRGIHWRTSAKRNELMVKEYHQNREFDLAILLDLWVPQAATEQHFENVELAVSFAATMALEHMRECRDAEVSLLVASESQSLLKLRPGQAAEDALLDRLAVVESYTGQVQKAVLRDWDQIRSSQLRTVVISTRSLDDPDLWDDSTPQEVIDSVRESDIVRVDSEILQQHLLLD